MLFLALASAFIAQSSHAVQPSGQLLDSKHSMRPGVYEAVGQDGHPAWIVRGNDFSLDLSSRTLRASGTGKGQDANTGIGVLVDGCTNVTLKNLDVSGFRVNIMLKDCKNVRILGCRASKSRAIRMGNAGKPVDTFLNLRNIDAWRGYGAGIWLERCDGCYLERNSASLAQNGVVLVECSHCNLVNNDCSTNGGWGFALWHSDRNTLAWNHADFCNRPWAGGWGGDSAGIVAVNICIANQFIANSITHGGDGFFLSDRLNGGFDTKKGTYNFATASNNNFIAHNDGSWSPNNAFEGTFSEANLYYGNHAEESNYGFWLGFSNSSFVYDNEILKNRSEGIAIGQGMGSMIYRNRIIGNGNVGVHIWSDDGPARTARPSDQNRVIENQIIDSKLAVSLERTNHAAILNNTIRNAAIDPKIKRGIPPLAESMRLASWKQSSTAKRLDGWMLKRPANWQFYRDTAGPKGQEALKVGDFAPDRG